MTEVSRGNYDEAVIYIDIVESLNPPVGRFTQLELAYYLMGRGEDAERLFSEFEKRAIENPVSDAWWVRAYVGIADFEQALERLETAVEQRELGDLVPLTSFAANPWQIPELDKPEFRALLDELWSDR